MKRREKTTIGVATRSNCRRDSARYGVFPTCIPQLVCRTPLKFAVNFSFCLTKNLFLYILCQKSNVIFLMFLGSTVVMFQESYTCLTVFDFSHRCIDRMNISIYLIVQTFFFVMLVYLIGPINNVRDFVFGSLCQVVVCEKCWSLCDLCLSSKHLILPQ